MIDRIHVGESATKLSGLVRAVALLKGCVSPGMEVQTNPAASQVPDQPIGRYQTHQGALNRAYAVGPTGTWRLGVENGLIGSGPSTSEYDMQAVLDSFDESLHHWDAPCCVLLDPLEQQTVVWGTGFPVPYRYIREVLAADPVGSLTWGQALARHVQCDPTDPHAYLSGGRISRVYHLEQATATVLAMGLYEYEEAKKNL